MTEYSQLDEAFITARFPELKEQIEQKMQSLGEFLPHVIFGDVFNALTVSLLQRDDYLKNDTLRRIFDMYEQLASDGDEDVQSLVQVTLLECLWDNKTVHERASRLIGGQTRELWSCIADYLKTP